MLQLYGGSVATRVLTAINRLCVYYLQWSGHTISVKEFVTSKSLSKKRRESLAELVKVKALNDFLICFKNFSRCFPNNWFISKYWKERDWSRNLIQKKRKKSSNWKSCLWSVNYINKTNLFFIYIYPVHSAFMNYIAESPKQSESEASYHREWF